MWAALLTALAVFAALGPIGGARPRTPGPADLRHDIDPGPIARRHPRSDGSPSPRASCSRHWCRGGAGRGVGRGRRRCPRIRALVTLRSARRAIDAALPDSIEMLVLVIQTGMTPHQAINVLVDRAPPPVRPAFVEVRHRVRRGAPLADALDALPDTLGPSANAVADTLAMAERHGTPIAQTMEQLALDVRERRRRRAEAEARKLPIRMSFPLVACTLPSFVLIAIVPAVLAAMASLGDTGF